MRRHKPRGLPSAPCCAALCRTGRALIGDEMGLGKTVQAIAVAAAYRDEWPVLIIAPSSLRGGCNCRGWWQVCSRPAGGQAGRLSCLPQPGASSARQGSKDGCNLLILLDHAGPLPPALLQSNGPTRCTAGWA